VPCGRGRQKNGKRYPKSYIDDSGDAEGEMADASTKQVHFAQDRAQDWKRFHGDADPNRRDEFNWADAGKKLVGMPRQNRIADQQA
jgi:hypothetical protein